MIPLFYISIKFQTSLCVEVIISTLLYSFDPIYGGNYVKMAVREGV